MASRDSAALFAHTASTANESGESCAEPREDGPRDHVCVCVCVCVRDAAAGLTYVHQTAAHVGRCWSCDHHLFMLSAAERSLLLAAETRGTTFNIFTQIVPDLPI